MRFLLFLIVLTLIPSTYAHLDAGEDIIKEGHILDFGYSPSTLLEGQRATLAFNLVNESTEEVITFESLWVRIEREETIVFSGKFFPEAEHVTFAYTFAESGHYIIKADFGEVEHDYSVFVRGKPDYWMILSLALIFAIGVMALLVYKKVNTLK